MIYLYIISVPLYFCSEVIYFICEVFIMHHYFIAGCSKLLFVVDSVLY